MWDELTYPFSNVNGVKGPMNVVAILHKTYYDNMVQNMEGAKSMLSVFESPQYLAAVSALCCLPTIGFKNTRESMGLLPDT